jgi:PAS domain S-box-containing protein
MDDNDILIVNEEILKLQEENNSLKIKLKKSKKSLLKIKKKNCKHSDSIYQNALTQLSVNLPQSFVIIDIKGRIKFTNEAFLSSHTLTLEDCIGKYLIDFFPKEFVRKYSKEFERLIKTGKTKISVEKHNKFDSSEQIYFEVTKSPIYNKRNKIKGIQIVFDDLTEQYQFESELTQLNLIQSLSTKWIHEYLTSPFAKYDEVIANSLSEIGKTFYVDRILLFENEIKDSSTLKIFEWCNEGANPSNKSLDAIPTEILTKLINSNKGVNYFFIDDNNTSDEKEFINVYGFEGFKSLLIIPIFSEVKCIGYLFFESMNEKELWNDTELNLLTTISSLISNYYSKKSTEVGSKFLSQVFTQTANSIMITDRNGIIEYVNPAFEKISGYTRDEIIGEKPNILKSKIHSEEFYKNLWNTLNEGLVWKGEFLNKSKDGLFFWEFSTISPIFDEKGDIINFIAVNENINEKKNADQALVESENKYRNLVEKINEGLIFVDVKDVIIYVNKAFARIVGYSEKELIGKSSLNSLSPEELHSEIIEHNKKRTEGLSEQYEIEMLKSNGERIFVSVSASPVFDRDNRLIGSMAVCTDITEKREVKQSLLESEAKFRSYINHSPIAVFIVNEFGKFLEVNQSACKMLGFSEPELLNIAIADILPDDGKEAGLQHFGEVVQNGFAEGDLILLCKDGSRIWANITAVKLNNQRFIAFVQDITNRKNVEVALFQSELRYRTIVEGLSVGIVIHQDNKIVYVNSALLRMLGLTSSEMLQNRNVIDFVHPDDRDKVLNAIANAYTNKSNTDYLHSTISERIIKPNGTIFHVDASAIVIDFNERDAILVMLNDVSEKIKVESDLNKSQADLEAIFNNTTDSIWSIDKDLKIISLNQIFKRSFFEAYGVELQPGFSIIDKIPGYMNELWKSRFEKALNGERFSVIDKFEFEGLPNYVETSFNPILVGEEIIGLSCFGRDITQNRLAEEKLKTTHEIYAKVIKTMKGVPYIHNFESNSYDFIGLGCEELIGISQEDMSIDLLRTIIKENVLNLPPEIKNAYDAKNLLIEKKLDHYSADIRIQTPDGKEKWLSDNSIPMFNEKTGEVIGDLGILVDITDRKNYETFIKDNEERLRTLINTMPDIVCFKDAEGRWLIANDFDITLFELNGIDYKGKKDSELAEYSSFYKDVFIKSEDSDEVAWIKGSPSRADEFIPRPDGTKLTFDIIKVPIFNDNGDRKGLIVVGRDISQRKAAEEALKESESRNRAFLNTIPDLMFVFDKSGYFIDYHAADLNKLLLPPELFINKHITEVLPPEIAQLTIQKLDAAFKTNTMQIYTYELSINNEILIFESRLLPIDETKALSLVRDITEGKTSERKILDSLKEKETLLRELYHRTKNNMQVISSMLSLQASTIQNEEINKVLSEMGTRIKSMSLVHQKLYQSQNLSAINLREYIRDLTELLRDIFLPSSDSVQIEFNLEDVFVLIDYAVPCGLVINEIISNVFKYAFPNNVTELLKVTLSRNESSEITILIEDNGKGFDKDYDPRNTSTLGMQLVHGIVENQLNGSVTFTNDVGVKCEIRFTDNIYESTL